MSDIGKPSTAAEWVDATLAAGFTFGASYDIDLPAEAPWDGSFSVMPGTSKNFDVFWSELNSQLGAIGIEAVKVELVRRFPTGGRR